VGLADHLAGGPAVLSGLDAPDEPAKDIPHAADGAQSLVGVTPGRYLMNV
jgi:hypothetical protein